MMKVSWIKTQPVGISDRFEKREIVMFQEIFHSIIWI